MNYRKGKHALGFVKTYLSMGQNVYRGNSVEVGRYRYFVACCGECTHRGYYEPRPPYRVYLKI